MTDGIYHLVRAFEDDSIVHVDDSVDPIRDLETIQHELCAKDLQALESAVARETADVKKTQVRAQSAMSSLVRCAIVHIVYE